jgi:hypothetical protein
VFIPVKISEIQTSHYTVKIFYHLQHSLNTSLSFVIDTFLN